MGAHGGAAVACMPRLTRRRMAFVYSQQCCGGVCVSCLVVCAQEAKAKGFDVLILDTAGRLNVTAQPPRRIPYGTVIPCGTVSHYAG